MAHCRLPRLKNSFSTLPSGGQRSPGSVGETRCLRWQCLVRIPSERGQTKASTRNCERKPTTRRATSARKSGRKVVPVDPMHTKAQSWNSNLIRGPCSSSGRGPVRSRRLLNLRNRSNPHCVLALAGLLLSWWHRALRRDASAARVGGSCAAVTAPATTMTVRVLRLRTAEPSGWAQKLRGVCL